MTQLRIDLGQSSRPSIFDDISALGLDIGTESCVAWLRSRNLMRSGSSYRDEVPTIGLHHGTVLAERCNRLPSAGLKRLRKQPTRKGLYDEHAQEIWQEYLNPQGAVEVLNLQRIPADAMAFYHPFHLEPAGEWGIYIRIDELLKYSAALARQLENRVHAFSPGSLLAYALFEIFHHEFFHHLEESAATTIEILSPGLGSVKPIYWNYRAHKYEESVGIHPHRPLGEALANAYAHNALSFYSRVTFNFQVVQVKLYQAILYKYWLREPVGYRSAQKYIGGQHLSGAAQLLAMMLDSSEVNPEALLVLAKSVLVSGHSSFSHKAAIPTYFVGTPESLETFHSMVPAPLETYTNLFGLELEDTTGITDFLQKRKQELKQQRPGKGA